MSSSSQRRSQLEEVFRAERGLEVLNSLVALRPTELDELPFGAIQLDRTGRILAFNRRESQLSGLIPEQVIGKDFFHDIAPCTNVKEFAGQFHAGVAQKKLHAVFPFHFKFKTTPRDVTVTLYYHNVTDTIWVLVRG
jgi:photoactive yellow protein